MLFPSFGAMVLLIVVLLLFAGYTMLIMYYWRSWNAIPEFIPGDNVNTTISVIIPARNEEKNIGNLLQKLTTQTYPEGLFEIIVVDDNSTDSTAEIVQRFEQVKLILLQATDINSYKKKAIETGIAVAKGEMIVTTDADCLPTNNWLQQLAFFKEQQRSVFIAAPVSFISDKPSMLAYFQELDFLVLQGITGASVYRNIHSMCNGANLAYTRSAFENAGGFTDIDSIASGDDLLLMHKIWKKHPDAVHFLKSQDAIVTTEPMKTLRAFFNQRIRWASKARHYHDKRIIATLLLVYLFNLAFPVLFIAGFFSSVYWIWLAGLWFAKTAIEIPFVYAVARFFRKEYLLKYFFFFQPVHIAYTLVSGFLGQFGKYEWKGRKVR